MNFKGGNIVKVFINEFDGRKLYSIGLSKKKQDGSYDNGFISARFKKGVEVSNKSRIKIKEAWLSFNTNEGKTFPFVFINDFELISEANPLKESENSIRTEVQEQFEIKPEDLPF